MPDIQELIALGIVALVAGRLLWRRWARRNALTKAGGQLSSKASACGDCASAGPPPKEAPVRFYRKRT
jgi:hypothetical protein